MSHEELLQIENGLIVACDLIEINYCDFVSFKLKPFKNKLSECKSQVPTQKLLHQQIKCFNF